VTSIFGGTGRIRLRPPTSAEMKRRRRKAVEYVETGKKVGRRGQQSVEVLEAAVDALKRNLRVAQKKS
jgi:hypothetical protein